MENNQPIVQQNTGQVPTKKSLPVLYVVIIEVVLLVLVLGILLLALNYFKIISLPSFFTNQSAQNTTNSKTVTPTPMLTSLSSPLDPNSETVDSGITYYNLNNITISGIRENGAKLTIYSPTDPLFKVPELTVDKDTKILIGKKDAVGENSDASKLKTGDRIYIALSYNLKTTEWLVKNIYIVFDSSRQATGSAQ